jgi:hypothetical protein
MLVKVADEPLAETRVPLAELSANSEGDIRLVVRKGPQVQAHLALPPGEYRVFVSALEPRGAAVALQPGSA